MSAWSPAAALLWQCFRLTRARLLFVLGVATAFGWLLFDLALTSDGRSSVIKLVTIILTLLALMWAVFTPLMARTGRFPFIADFARPIRTSQLAVLPLLYLAAATAAVYLLPSLVLGAAFDVVFPGLPLVATIVAIELATVAAGWWTANKTVLYVGSFVLVGALFAGGVFDVLFAFTFDPLNADSPVMPEVGAADYLRLLIVLAGAFALTIWGVERQRRGDRWAELLEGRGRRSLAARTAELRRDGARELWRAPCPISSPVRAELWLQMKCRGAPALAWGVMLAAAIPVLFWTARSWEPGLLMIVSFGMLVAPLFAGVSASIWGRRSAWGATQSAFEATRPLETAQLAGLQVLVIVACVLVAWTLMGASAWVSLGLLRDLQGPGFTLEGLAVKRAAAAALGALPGWRIAGLAAIAMVELIAFVAFLVALRTLTARYAKRLFLGACALAAYTLVLLFVLAANVDSAFAEGSLTEYIVKIHVWIAAVGIPLGTVYLIGRVLLDRIASFKEAAAVVGAWALFAVVYLALLRDSGIRLLDMPPALALLRLTPLLLPLAAAALAPWSLARVRHC